MGYYTTVKVFNREGKPVKAEINCGGQFRGFTDESTGALGFELSSQGTYDISAKRFGDKIYGKVRGGGDIALKFTK